MNQSGTFSRLSISLIVVFILLSSFQNAEAQRQQAPPIGERIFYGGNFGLQFGTLTDIQVSPVVGFWILPRLAVAAGPSYRFYKLFDDRTHIYGGKAYVEFTMLRNINSVIPIGANTDIILHLENEILSLERAFFYSAGLDGRFTMNTVLGGAGLSQQIGKRSALNILVLWALNEPEFDMYSNPEIRFSFMF